MARARYAWPHVRLQHLFKYVSNHNLYFVIGLQILDNSRSTIHTPSISISVVQTYKSNVFILTFYHISKTIPKTCMAHIHSHNTKSSPHFFTIVFIVADILQPF